MYERRGAVHAAVFTAVGVQRRHFEVVLAVGRGEVIPYVPPIFVRGQGHGDRRFGVVADQPGSVPGDVVPRRELLHVQRQIHRVRHVHVEEGSVSVERDAVRWKIRD